MTSTHIHTRTYLVYRSFTDQHAHTQAHVHTFVLQSSRERLKYLEFS